MGPIEGCIDRENELFFLNGSFFFAGAAKGKTMAFTIKYRSLLQIFPSSNSIVDGWKKVQPFFLSD